MAEERNAKRGDWEVDERHAVLGLLFGGERHVELIHLDVKRRQPIGIGLEAHHRLDTLNPSEMPAVLGLTKVRVHVVPHLPSLERARALDGVRRELQAKGEAWLVKRKGLPHVVVEVVTREDDTRKHDAHGHDEERAFPAGFSVLRIDVHGRLVQAKRYAIDELVRELRRQPPKIDSHDQSEAEVYRLGGGVQVAKAFYHKGHVCWHKKLTVLHVGKQYIWHGRLCAAARETRAVSLQPIFRALLATIIDSNSIIRTGKRPAAAALDRCRRRCMLGRFHP